MRHRSQDRPGRADQYQALSDWRDPDSDPLFLKMPKAPEGLACPSWDGAMTITEKAPRLVEDRRAHRRRRSRVLRRAAKTHCQRQEAGNLPPVAATCSSAG